MSDCQHPDEILEWRKWLPKLGSRVPTFRRQCLECLEPVGPAIDPLELRDRLGVDPAEVVLAKPAPRARSASGLGGRGNSRRRALAKFYRTAAWRKQRARVLERDRYRCADCGAPATEVAHIRYADPIERTPDRDCKASCRACNQAEREQRITRSVLGG